MIKILRNLSIIVFIISLVAGFLYDDYCVKAGGDFETSIETDGLHYLVQNNTTTLVDDVAWNKLRVFYYFRFSLLIFAFIGGAYLIIYMAFLRDY